MLSLTSSFMRYFIAQFMSPGGGGAHVFAPSSVPLPPISFSISFSSVNENTESSLCSCRFVDGMFINSCVYLEFVYSC